MGSFFLRLVYTLIQFNRFVIASRKVNLQFRKWNQFFGRTSKFILTAQVYNKVRVFLLVIAKNWTIERSGIYCVFK